MSRELEIASADWFSSSPLEYYAKIGTESAENVPDKSPIKPVFGAPSIDVRTGPIIRLLGTLENGSQNYRGTILLVTADETSNYENGKPPSIDFTVGPASRTALADESVSHVSVSSGLFPGRLLYQEAGYSFWVYDIELLLSTFEQHVSYTINGTHKPEFQFYIQGLEQSMNVVSFSCNGFSLATDTADYKNSLWYDVLNNHDKHHYHVALGGGDQLYCDKVKNVSALFHEWLEEANPLKKIKAPFTEKLAGELADFYLNAYISWFGQGWWAGNNGKTLQALFPAALASIPTVNIYDDHDIIDGYGTYKHATMNTDIFKGLGKVAYKYYMLFQHHTLFTDESHLKEPSWILGSSPGPYIQELAHSNYVRLGKEIAFVGFDCRTERKKDQVLTTASYDKIFARLSKEISAAKGDIKHLLVLLGVPIAYPRLVWLEKLLTSKLFIPVRALAQKGIIAKGLVNEFDGSVEVLDDLEDHWCAKHHKHERNYLVGKLQEFGAQNAVRITILSGDVHLAAIGRFKSKVHKHTVRSKKIETNERVLQEPETDPRLILNVISSAITNAPPPDAMATLLYKRSKIHRFDHNTQEDMVRLFRKDVDGTPRTNNQFNNKRNWCDLILAKQLPKYNSVEPGVGKHPGLLDGDDLHLLTKTSENTLDHVAYPILPDSLATVIHIEKTPSVINSDSALYEVVIPPLSEKSVLEGVDIK